MNAIESLHRTLVALGEPPATTHVHALRRLRARTEYGSLSQLNGDHAAGFEDVSFPRLAATHHDGPRLNVPLVSPAASSMT